jgi:hypothetical protein
MLGALLKFESVYHFRQLTFIIAALLFFGLGILCAQGNFGGDAVHTNAPYVITFVTGLLSLFTIFVSTVFCANVVLRDNTWNMEPIIFTTAIKRGPYFLVRFLGLLLSVFLVLCLAVAGTLTGALLADNSRLGAFDPAFFLQPLLVIGLPNVLFVSSIIFCTAILTRSIKAIYAAGVLLYILYSVAAILGNSPLFASSALKTGTPDVLPLLTDPFALAIYLGDTRSWTAVQRNELLYPLSGLLLQNRLLWTLCSLLQLGITYRLFSFRLSLPAQSKPTGKADTSTPNVAYTECNVQPQGYRYTLNSFISQFRLESISVFKHVPFLVMLALWIFFFAIALKDTLLNGAYGVRLYPATSVIVDTLRSVKPAMLLIIFYVAELSARERSTNMQALIYSTPVPDAVIWAAKCATLGILAATLIAVNICIGIVFQLSNGYTDVDLRCYLSLFFYSGLPLFLFAILALFVQTIARNKYTGMLINIFLAAFLVFSHRLGVEHYLLRYATVPDMSYSDMNAFGHYAMAFRFYMLYWGILAILLSLLTIRLWPRSQYIPIRSASIGKDLRWMIPLPFFIAAGIFIYYKSNIEGKYKSSKAAIDWQLSYEQKYRPLAALPQPVITSVKTTVDLYPDQGRYTVNGVYQLWNPTSQPIAKIWVGIDPEVSACTISLPGIAHTVVDKAFGQYWYKLKTPLLPGSGTSLRFSMEVIRSGFTAFNNEHAVVPNGTYIELEKYVPFLGYNDRYETQHPLERKKKGMPPYTPLFSSDSVNHLINLETTISTTAPQQVVTVGTLLRSWSANNRKYFTYKTTVPVRFMFGLSSAKYAVQQETNKGITFSIYYQPGHSYNIATMMQAAKDAVDYGSRHFGAYPFKHLTLAEIPQYRGAATAYPGVVFCAENINFLTNFSDTSKINYTYSTIAHEVAHQWWANVLSPASQPGSAFLTETLAQYTEAMILEKKAGKMQMRAYLKADNQLYFALRPSDAGELPLAQATGQSFVHYQKGSLAMYALKESLGEKRINAALRRLLERHADARTSARTEDFISQLYEGASASDAKLIDDWLKQVFVYSLQLEVLSCKPLPNGQYDLQLRIQVHKTDQQRNRNVPPADDIDVAVFDVPQAEWTRHTKPVYLQKHHFSRTDTSIRITVNKRPVVATIDPYCYMPDANQQNNLREID